ncbi:transposase [Streptomyces sp. NPDC014746]|uniref:transposase n=1 Tax=Streptomyces sp. NPDC014746 TaxID=3364904 RepID=UPI0036F4CFF6
MTVRGDATDETWDRLRPLLAMDNGRCGRWRGHHQVVDGILCRVGTGVQWRDLTKRFGP